MDSIKDIIPQVVEKIICQKAGEHRALEQSWQDVLETQELKHVKLVGLRDGNVLVSVDSPVRAYHLRMRKTKILKQLQEKIAGVKDIIFKVNGEQK